MISVDNLFKDLLAWHWVADAHPEPDNLLLHALNSLGLTDLKATIFLARLTLGLLTLPIDLTTFSALSNWLGRTSVSLSFAMTPSGLAIVMLEPVWKPGPDNRTVFKNRYKM